PSSDPSVLLSGPTTSSTRSWSSFWAGSAAWPGPSPRRSSSVSPTTCWSSAPRPLSARRWSSSSSSASCSGGPPACSASRGVDPVDETTTSTRFVRDWALPIILVGLLLAAPFALSEFRLNLLGRFLTYAIVAIGLDLIWGYGGMLSLGQGLFFGLGAYSMA